MFPIDSDTILTSDKFGNLGVSRIDENISRQIEEDWTILKNSESIYNSCPFKLINLIDFHLGEIITKFQFINNNESILYCGIFGTLGVLTPLISKKKLNC